MFGHSGQPCLRNNLSGRLVKETSTPVERYNFMKCDVTEQWSTLFQIRLQDDAVAQYMALILTFLILLTVKTIFQWHTHG
jgi:hypothetical protein